MRGLVRMRWVPGLLAWGVVLAASTAVRALPVIDEFDAPPGGQVVDNASPSSSVTGLAGVAGGSRQIDLTIQTTFAGSQSSETRVISAPPGVLDIANDSGVDSAVSITWDEDTSGMDLDLSGYTGLALEGVFNDRSTSYTITLETFGLGTSTLAIGQAGEFTGDIDFAFSSFAGTAVLSNIDRIVLTVDGARAADISLDRLVAVPEPGTAAAVGLGLAGLAGFARSRRRPS